jgi:hypothetical protein
LARVSNFSGSSVQSSHQSEHWMLISSISWLFSFSVRSSHPSLIPASLKYRTQWYCAKRPYTVCSPLRSPSGVGLVLVPPPSSGDFASVSSPPAGGDVAIVPFHPQVVTLQLCPSPPSSGDVATLSSTLEWRRRDCVLHPRVVTSRVAGVGLPRFGYILAPLLASVCK